MDEFFTPQEWLPFAVSSSVELTETEYDYETIVEKENITGQTTKTIATSTGTGTFKKSGESFGPYMLNIFSRTEGQEDGIRVEIRGCNFNGKQYGKVSHKTWIVSGGLEIFSGETTHEPNFT